LSKSIKLITLSKLFMASKTLEPVVDPERCWGMKKQTERDLGSVRG
jgi:hypothetical protein